MSRTPNAQRPTPNAQRLIINIGLGVLASSMLLVACQKEALAPGDSSGTNSSNVSPRIQAFIEQTTRSESTKSENTLTIDSAEWYIEAALNYSYSKAWLEFTDRSVDSITVTIPITNGSVDFQDVTAAFIFTKNHALQLFCNNSSELIVANVVQRESLVDLQLTLFYFLGNVKGKALNSYFTPGKSYAWGGDLSNCGCDSYAGGVGVCADKQIQARLNQALPALSVGSYFTDVVQVQWYGDDTSDLFSCIGPSCLNDCFSPSMLSSYTVSGWNLFVQSTPPGKRRISALIEWYWIPLGIDYQRKGHDALFTSGTYRTGAPTS